MSYRNFSEEIDVLAKRWSQKVKTNDHWSRIEKVSEATGRNETESKPDLVQCGPIRCIAKPSGPKKPRAAIEKIVSDLGYAMDLPTPPVLLWHDEAASDEAQQKALVAWAFAPALTWEEAAPNLTEDERAALVPAFSAIQVFETWISAHDRGGKHTLVNVREGVVQLAFIDYAYSLCHTWDRSDHPDSAIRSFAPLGLDADTQRDVVRKINELEEDRIRTVVERIPEGFLPAAKSDIIIQNLLSRRPRLTAMLGL